MLPKTQQRTDESAENKHLQEPDNFLPTSVGTPTQVFDPSVIPVLLFLDVVLASLTWVDPSKSCWPSI